MPKRRDDLRDFIKKDKGRTPRLDIARRFQMHPDTVWRAERMYGIVRPALTKTEIKKPATLKEASEIEKLQKTIKDKTRYEKRIIAEYEQLEKDHDALLQLREAPHTPYHINPYHPRGRHEATAIAMLSDVHCEEIVKASKVNYLNEYSPDIASERVETFFAKVKWMLDKERKDTTIDNLILWLGGDFFSSNLHEELPSSCAFPPMEAAIFAQNLLISGIQFLQKNANCKITVVCSVGNHSRITKKVYIATEHEHSIEWFMYNTLKSIFDGKKDTTFLLHDSALAYVQVYKHMFRFMHGHIGLRYGGGVGGLHIPLRKAIDQKWDKQTKADVTILGHFHQYLPSRDYNVNGSVIGFSPYGATVGAYEPPMQSFLLVDKNKGVIDRKPIFL